jgi:hypothetical protein
MQPEPFIVDPLAHPHRSIIGITPMALVLRRSIGKPEWLDDLRRIAE